MSIHGVLRSTETTLELEHARRVVGFGPQYKALPAHFLSSGNTHLRFLHFNERIIDVAKEAVRKDYFSARHKSTTVFYEASCAEGYMPFYAGVLKSSINPSAISAKVAFRYFKVRVTVVDSPSCTDGLALSGSLDGTKTINPIFGVANNDPDNLFSLRSGSLPNMVAESAFSGEEVELGRVLAIRDLLFEELHEVRLFVGKSPVIANIHSKDSKSLAEDEDDSQGIIIKSFCNIIMASRGRDFSPRVNEAAYKLRKGIVGN